MQSPQTIASSGGLNVRPLCLDSGLKMVGQCWDLADGGWLQVALPDGVKFSTSPLHLTSIGVSTKKGHMHWKVYQSASVRTLEAQRAKRLSPLSHEAEVWHTGSNNFVKQFANASALDYWEKFRPSHQSHEKHLQKIKASCISVLPQTCDSFFDGCNQCIIKSESAGSVRPDCS